MNGDDNTTELRRRHGVKDLLLNDTVELVRKYGVTGILLVLLWAQTQVKTMLREELQPLRDQITRLDLRVATLENQRLNTNRP